VPLLGSKSASLAYAIAFVGVFWAGTVLLARRGVRIKI